jgi:hypothetical protein
MTLSKLFISLASLGVITAASAADTPAPPLQTEFVFEARVKVDRPLVIGQSLQGFHRVIPITTPFIGSWRRNIVWCGA